MTRVGRPRRSVSTPPRGTERIVTQIARLTMKPASPSETPRATSIAGPKATTATRLALKQPQAKPALSASLTSRRGSRARRAGGPAALPSARDHEREARHDRAALAQALAEHPTRQSEERAGQHVDADERTELRPGEPELGDEERAHGGDGLELVAHRRARDEHDRERDPAAHRCRVSRPA